MIGRRALLHAVPASLAPISLHAAASPAAFASADEALRTRLADVQSAVMLSQGRPVYRFHRDDAPDRLRDTKSVTKSALSMLVGIPLGEGRIPGVQEAGAAARPRVVAPERGSAHPRHHRGASAEDERRFRRERFADDNAIACASRSTTRACACARWTWQRLAS